MLSNLKGHDNLKWILTEEPISIKLNIGEINIYQCHVNGIRSMPDIFTASPLSCLEPPIGEMKQNCVKVARIHSCPLNENIRRVSIKKNTLCYIDEMYKYYFVDLRGSFQDYLESKKHYTDIKKMPKKIKEINCTNEGAYFKIYSTPEEFIEFFNLSIPLMKKTFQYLLLGKDMSKTFQEKVIQQSKNGAILGYILMINQEPAAYNLCPIYDKNKVFYGKSGYDPKYKKYSPGTVLHYKIIEDLFNRKELHYYDLCTGEGLHKKIFSTGFVYCGDIYYCLIYSKYTFVFLIKMQLKYITIFFKKVLEYFKIKDIVKKKTRGVFIFLKNCFHSSNTGDIA